MSEKQFKLELARLLEKHRVAICSRKFGMDYSEIFFQKIETKPHNVINTETKRCHVTAYELRCQSGMTSSEANKMHRDYKESLIPKCCVCGTTENLHKDGWYGYRCDSSDCVCF